MTARSTGFVVVRKSTGVRFLERADAALEMPSLGGRVEPVVLAPVHVGYGCGNELGGRQATYQRLPGGRKLGPFDLDFLPAIAKCSAGRPTWRVVDRAA